MDLNEIIPDVKTGNEKFTHKGKQLDFQLLDFWSWNQSDLIENRTRGILAEFIVKKALGVESHRRVEWDNYDLVTESGKRIEVKSSAYIQTWKQSKYSNTIFGISESIGAKDHPEYDGLARRWADKYIFCLLKHKDQESINPLNLDQWTFYVIDTKVLDEKIPKQKTITLNSLLELKPSVCDFSELESVVEDD